jgi:Integrase zinc binding domain
MTLESNYYISNMEAQTIHYVKHCPVCQQGKPLTKKYGEIPLSIQQYLPWQVCQVDLFGPWTFKDKDGNEHKLQALSIIDIVTRWPETIPYSSKPSDDISLLFNQVWLCHYLHQETVNFGRNNIRSIYW